MKNHTLTQVSWPVRLSVFMHRDTHAQWEGDLHWELKQEKLYWIQIWLGFTGWVLCARIHSCRRRREVWRWVGVRGWLHSVKIFLYFFFFLREWRCACGWNSAFPFISISDDIKTTFWGVWLGGGGSKLSMSYRLAHWLCCSCLSFREELLLSVMYSALLGCNARGYSLLAAAFTLMNCKVRQV